ncbi:MAG: alpha/beta fold hydrolase, partial [Betaproteobacteria bacterium]
MPVSATVILVHSPLVGPSTWRGVAKELTDAGYEAVVPDLRGAHDNRAIVAAMVEQSPRDRDIVLIGHSRAGPLLPAIADALGRVSSIVYVDARLPRPGVSWVDDAPQELVDHIRSTVDADNTVARWPDWWPPEELPAIVPDEDQRRTLLAESPRLPWSFFTEPQPSATWRGPESYLLLSEPYQDAAETMRAAGHPVLELPSDHLAPLTRPAEVAAVLLQLLDTPLSGLLFGAYALSYDDVRMEYPDILVDEALAYAGNPASAVEIGAGTGKASEAFAARGVRLTCVEPDHAMAAVLRKRFHDRPQVTVVERTFEEWTPPDGGVPLLCFALSWHWADPVSRTTLAAAALCPGGTLALLDHEHAFADRDLQRALDAVYDDVAPQLRALPDKVGDLPTDLKRAELMGSGLFTDLHSTRVAHDHPYPTPRYIELLRTFSPHIALAPARREALHARIAAVVDSFGGVVMVRLVTT